MEIVTVEKTELMRLIESAVSSAVAKVLKPPDEIMTKDEAAKYLKKSTSTITRWMKTGLPYHGNGRPTFKRSEIDEWLAKN